MGETGDEDNWLHAEVFDCLTCRRALFRVDHSPFYDEWHLYCDRCSNKVEVSYYDKFVNEWNRLHKGSGWEHHLQRLRAI